MRTENAVKNSISSGICYMASCLLVLVSRKLFLNLLGEELLGYDGLFKNILSLLTVFDMGAGSAITYQLYNVIGKKDYAMINQLMTLYKMVYCVIAFLILIAGCAAIPFLPYLASDSSLGFCQLTGIYLLQMLGMLSTYFMAYKRIRFVAEQQEYVCIRIELLANVTAQIIKVLVIYWQHSYWMYLLVAILQNLLSNIIIAMKYRKIFGKRQKCKLTKTDYARWHIFSDMKNFILHKIGYLVYTATDNIVISVFMGIPYVAFYTNYVLVVNYVNVFINKLITPLTASIANLVYDDKHEKGINLFYALDFICYLIGVFMMSGIITCMQTFIYLWVGKEYILPAGFLILLAMNIYVGWNQTALAIFRSVYGNFQEDRKYYLMSASVNLLVSIALVNRLGLAGIMIGTVTGHLFIGFGRVKFVFHQYVKTSFRPFLWKKLFRTVIATGECFVVYKIVEKLPISIGGIILRVILVTGILGMMNLLIFYRDKSFQTAITYARSSITTIFKTRKNKNI